MRKISEILTPLQTICLVSGFTSAILAAHPAQAVSITGVDFLGQSILPTRTTFQGTEVGGLSGITYDPSRNVYYSISDDRSEINPARFYTLTIDLSDGALTQGEVTPVGVTTLLTASGQRFAPLSLDLEGIAFTNRGTVFISSEGEANPIAGRVIAPFVNEFSLQTGQQVSTLPVPGKFLQNPPFLDLNNDGVINSSDQPFTPSRGVRNNLAFENLTITPDQRYLFTATENAIAQDGPPATLNNGSPSRILKYDLTTGQPVAEFLYNTDPVALPPNPPTAFNTNGLVDLLAIDDSGTEFLALERSFSTGATGTPGNTGNTIKLYEVSLHGATDIDGIDSLQISGTSNIVSAQKRLLLDLTDLGIPTDNIEGLTFGPDLPDGRRSLVVVSDNNFSPTQFTQVAAFGLRSESSPAVPEPSSMAGGILAVLLGIGAKWRKRSA
jgi:hypothetical protein